MASEPATKTLNGNHGNQPYGTAEQSQGSVNHTGTAEDASSVPNAGNNSTSGASEGNANVSKDEVGWYFVEQYYTTLSKFPEKLHLFYSKQSQFVSGVEAEKVSVSVGQRAINDQIRELDIQDCKVRVTNVDSQESFKNIVVQVIGEMSNKAAPHRKFVQTFVLAEQPNGYFVLNDIFRYISEEEEEENEESNGNEALAAGAESATIIESAEPYQQPGDAEQVDRKLEDEGSNQTNVSDNDITDIATNGDTATQDTTLEEVETADAVDTPDAHDVSDAPVTNLELSPEEKECDVSQDSSEAGVATTDEVQPEKPQDPDLTPVASPPAPPKTTPAQAPPAVAAKPAAPKTWAKLVAANRVAQPAIPIKAATPPAPKAAPSTANRSASPPTTPSVSPGRPQENGNSGWQTAGPENGRKQGRPQPTSGSSERGNVTLGYVKNVTERVNAAELRDMFQKFGKLTYFDVSHQRNCAFVEFADPAGYSLAVSANPHIVGGEQIVLEERKPRANAYGGSFSGGRGAARGRGGNDSRGGGQGRGNYGKDGGRGGYVPRGRGGSTTPRGRGQPPAT